MADDKHVENLRAARNQMVDQRRKMAETLAQNYPLGATTKAPDKIILMQNAIKAIDEAIEDEENLDYTGPHVAPV